MKLDLDAIAEAGELRDALIWASGAFQGEALEKAWAKTGAPALARPKGEHLAALTERIRKEATQRACSAICAYCSLGIPVTQDGEHHDTTVRVRDHDKGLPHLVRCKAAAIRAGGEEL